MALARSAGREPAAPDRTTADRSRRARSHGRRPWSRDCGLGTGVAETAGEHSGVAAMRISTGARSGLSSLRSFFAARFSGLDLPLVVRAPAFTRQWWRRALVQWCNRRPSCARLRGSRACFRAPDRLRPDAAEFRGVDSCQSWLCPENVVTANASMPKDRYPGKPEMVAFYRTSLAQVRALPGATRAATVDASSFRRERLGKQFRSGRPAGAGLERHAQIRPVSSRLFSHTGDSVKKRARIQRARQREVATRCDH